jgi:hypothetical protein
MKSGTCGESGYNNMVGVKNFKVKDVDIRVIKYKQNPCETQASQEGFTNYQSGCNDLLNHPNNPQGSFRYDNYYDF